MTDIGAFNVDGTGQVFLYYESKNNLNNKHRNYVATELHNQINFVSAVNAIKYTDVTDRDLTIYVYAENSRNEWSEFVSVWRVPRMDKRCAKPMNLKVIEKTKEMIEIGWMASEINATANSSSAINLCSHITSYTVFWCESRTKQPNSCDGSIQFKRVWPRRSNEYRIQLQMDKSSIVAVSANSHDSSSGMVWLNE